MIGCLSVQKISNSRRIKNQLRKFFAKETRKASLFLVNMHFSGFNVQRLVCGNTDEGIFFSKGTKAQSINLSRLICIAVAEI